MAQCAYCGETILAGGVDQAGYRFCNQKCRENGYLLSMADEIPEEILNEHVMKIYQGTCPSCGGSGPIDVHTHHTVWSVIVLSSWQSHRKVCCHSCGVKSKLGAALFSGVAGWWGIPWGIFMTPTQVMRNIFGLFTSSNPIEPSEQLKNMIKVDLAAQYLESQQEQDQPEE